MSESAQKPRRWIGRSILVIATIHTLFAVAAFGGVVQEIIADGIFNAVGEDAMRGAVAWFFFAGFLMALLGMAVDLLEKHSAGHGLKGLGIALILFCILGIVLMPVSGFWLMLVPAFAMIWRGRNK